MRSVTNCPFPRKRQQNGQKQRKPPEIPYCRLHWKRTRTNIAPQGLYRLLQPRTQDTELGGLGTYTGKLIERESRTDKFLPDPDLPESQAVTTDDYKRSGMDRGHMCPAGDNRWHWKAMQESFYMTNICPQNHNLNRGDWKELEEACRLWAKKKGKSMLSAALSSTAKSTALSEKTQNHRTRSIFKVILCTNSNPPKAIGFIYKIHRATTHWTPMSTAWTK